MAIATWHGFLARGSGALAAMMGWLGGLAPRRRLAALAGQNPAALDYGFSPIGGF